MAARLALRSRRDLPCVLVWTLRVRRQLSESPGVVGYGLGAQLTDKTCWVASAWTDRGDLAAFDRSGAHATAKQALRARMLPPMLAVWRCRVDELPVSWDDIGRRVADVRRSPRSRGGSDEKLAFDPKNDLDKP